MEKRAMRSNYCKAILNKAVLAVSILLVSAGISFAQTVSLTATRQTTTLPDGNTVAMWGWVCGTTGAPATCSGMNGLAQTPAWQPPLITVPLAAGATTGTLTINLTNNLPVETSLTIVGQLGGGLGAPVREGGPRTDGAHQEQTQATWTTNIPATFLPPAQGARARSFAPEAAPNTGTQSYSWSALKPGTYLIETGTYPSIQGPMGLYGVLVVTVPSTAAAAGMAYPAPAGATAANLTPGLPYDADAVAMMSEIDPVQNSSVDAFLVKSAGCTAGTGTCTGTVSAAAEMTKWSLACST